MYDLSESPDPSQSKAIVAETHNKPRFETLLWFSKNRQLTAENKAAPPTRRAMKNYKNMKHDAEYLEQTKNWYPSV